MPVNPEVTLVGEGSRTKRGFEIVKFRDKSGDECSLQESSACAVENEDGSCDNPHGFLWLGIDDAKPQLMKSDARKLGLPIVDDGEHGGWTPYLMPSQVFLSTRMHLDEKQVRGLVARLQMWLDVGYITTPEERGEDIVDEYPIR